MKKDEVSVLHEEIKQLRISYEKYFAGIDRLEPLRQRDRVKKRLRGMFGGPNFNTARRFRLQQLQATLVSHEQYWNRITRQIEEGTYKRDKLRAQRMIEEKTGGAQASASGKNGSSSTSRQNSTASTDSLQQLHSAYVEARKKLGHRAISMESLAKTVASQTEAIKKRYNCSTVEFKVAVKDGKAILKAVPKS